MARYIDSSVMAKRGVAFGIIGENADDIIFAGTTIHAMEGREKNAIYENYAIASDVQFIFDDNIPAIDFYPVPRLDIFAKDSQGGCFAAYGEAVSMDSAAAICYVDKEKKCFRIENNLPAFLHKLDAGIPWRAEMEEMRGIVLFASSEEAMQSLDFIALPDAFCAH